MLTELGSPFKRCGCGITTDAPSGLCLQCTMSQANGFTLPAPSGGWTASEVRQKLRLALQPYAKAKQSGLKGFMTSRKIESSYTRTHDFLTGKSDNPPQALLRAMRLETRYGPRLR